MTADLRAALHTLATALPAGAAVPVPREQLLELLEATPAPGTTGAAGLADLTLGQLAARFGRSPSTVRGWLEAGQLPGAYKLQGRSWRVPEVAVQAFLGVQRGEADPALPVQRLQRGQSIGDWRKLRDPGRPSNRIG